MPLLGTTAAFTIFDENEEVNIVIANRAPISATIWPSHSALGARSDAQLVHVWWCAWSTKSCTNHAAHAPPNARIERRLDGGWAP